MANLQLFAKCGLALLVVVSLAVLIERLTSSRSVETDLVDSGSGALMINTTISPTIDIVESVFNENFTKCIREHSKSYYYPITARKNISFSCQPPGSCIHNFLIDSSKLMLTFDIKLQLLEPSILFCLLPSSRKYNLLTRGFSLSEVRGLKNVVTFGIYPSEAKIFDEANTRKTLISLGYRILRFQSKNNIGLINGYASEDIEVSHYFIMQYDMVMHIIVLYPRGTYLFSPAFDTSEISLKGLQYVDDRAFENFTTSTVYLDTLSKAPVLLPFDTRCFLLDMMLSKFLECKAVPSDANSTMNNEVLLGLKELKVVLASQMVTFWLWSKSLQGWYEKCDIQHYSEELQFSVAAKSVQGFNFSALFTDSKCQHVESYSNLTGNITNVKLSCYGVPINLIFMYEDKVTYWNEHIDGRKTYRLRYPKFTLCSTDAYQQKIGIPCETDEILESEYGQFLKNTTLNLDPNTMKNVLLMEGV